MKFIQNLPTLLSLTALIFVLTSCGHDETADEEPAFRLTVDQIVQEFLDDEEAANSKFNDQIIEVSGPVMELNKQDGMITGIKLSSDEFNIVNCSFQDPLAESSKVSELVTVKGVCSGFLGDASSMLPGGTVELKRAVLVTKEAN